MTRVKWMRTLDGNPASFPNIGKIEKGRLAWLTDDEAKMAAGCIDGEKVPLARVLTEAEAPGEEAAETATAAKEADAAKKKWEAQAAAGDALVTVPDATAPLDVPEAAYTSDARSLRKGRE